MLKVCAIIVTHNPDDRLFRNINIILPQVDKIIIVDNASESNDIAELDRIINNPKVVYISNDENMGLAAGLNQGIRCARDLRYKWAILFDQDSIATKDYLKNIRNTYDAYESKEKLAIISPMYINPKTNNKATNHKNTNELFKEILVALTSGATIRLDIFEKVGYFDEYLFVDYVDYEYCLRCRICGYHLIQSNRLILYHQVGMPSTAKVFSNRIMITNHSPLRRYYITRNRIIVFKRYYIYFPLWCINEIYCSFKDLIKIVLYENNKVEKIHAFGRGFIDGIISNKVVREFPFRS